MLSVPRCSAELLREVSYFLCVAGAIRPYQQAMPQHTQDHVHRLIHSMSRAERRYFKLFTGRHTLGGRSVYQLLFDAIASMDVYDEASLMSKFSDQAFTKRFPVTKRRLYEAILKSLDAFHAESSVDARLRRTLHQVEILHKRALYDDARKMLGSVRKLARQHDRQTILLETLAWERVLMESDAYSGTDEKDLNALQQRSNDLLEELRQVEQLWHLKSLSFVTLYHQGHARDKDRIKELRRVLQHPLLKSDARLLTAKARYLHHHVHSVADYAMGDLSACLHHLDRNLKLLDKEPHLVKDGPNLLIGVLSNSAYVAMRCGRTADAFDKLKRFRKLPQRFGKHLDADLTVKIFATGSSLEMAFHAQLGDMEKGCEAADRMAAELDRFAEKLSPLRMAGLCFQAAYQYFGIGRMDLALRWSHRQLNLKGIDESGEVHCFGRILNLLIHLERGDQRLLGYALRNTERYLKDRNRSYRFETAFLTFLRNRLKAHGPEAERQALQQFRDSLVPLVDDPLEQAVFDHFDPLAWVESKLSQRPFSEVVKERALKQTRAA